MKAWVALAVVFASVGVASAHDADLIYAQLERGGGDPAVRARITLSAATLALLAPVDGDRDGALSQAELDAATPAVRAGLWDAIPLSAAEVPCQLQLASARLKESAVELSAEFRCNEGELRQTFRILDSLPRGYRVALASVDRGRQAQQFLEGNEQTLVIGGSVAEPAEAKAAPPLDALGWVALGVRHILGGADHLAFLLALLLAARGLRQVLLLVTAFTLAHSVTLGATALGLIGLSAAQANGVEILIALSICWVAVENVLIPDPRPLHRVLLAFGFGLVHGFGFANVLRDLGLGESPVRALFGFNLGVELGQATVVVVAFPLLRFLSRHPGRHRLCVRAASAGILLTGGYWLAERALG